MKGRWKERERGKENGKGDGKEGRKIVHEGRKRIRERKS